MAQCIERTGPSNTARCHAGTHRRRPQRPVRSRGGVGRALAPGASSSPCRRGQVRHGWMGRLGLARRSRSKVQGRRSAKCVNGKCSCGGRLRILMQACCCCLQAAEKLFHVSAAAPAPFRLLWSCKSIPVHKISFVWSLIYFEFMGLSVDF